jgi:hypothetical protein
VRIFSNGVMRDVISPIFQERIYKWIPNQNIDI